MRDFAKLPTVQCEQPVIPDIGAKPGMRIGSQRRDRKLQRTEVFGEAGPFEFPAFVIITAAALPRTRSRWGKQTERSRHAAMGRPHAAIDAARLPRRTGRYYTVGRRHRRKRCGDWD